MSLYRKYRPKKFTEVIGQDHIVRTLQNQIKAGGISHAYLLCGTRGTGKTSIAKIFARLVTGDNPLADGIDIIEIDAASNNRVEDVRDLIEKTKYPPTYSKYKVYIIDEVHMFSNSSFNAFLKTLEEPLPHVIFILATTEPNKLPKTILSRVLRFDVRPVPVELLVKQLTSIFKKEGVIATPEAIRLISEAGNGSVRDALSTAEAVIAYSQNPSEIDVVAVLGKLDIKLLESLLDAIFTRDTKTLDKTLKTIASSSVTLNTVIVDIQKMIKTRFLQNPSKQILDTYKVFAELEMAIKTALNPQSMFDGACILALQ
ncbi:MAG: DNA polymerase III subunit gamma/tau [Firmicutes bacterium]|nr:DNA polymerase III subunit gamma/tau [Bacillota bacterium]